MTDGGRNFFDQPVKNDLRPYDNIGKITIGQEFDYTNLITLLKHFLTKQKSKKVDF